MVCRFRQVMNGSIRFDCQFPILWMDNTMNEMKVVFTLLVLLSSSIFSFGADFSRKYTGAIDGKYAVTMQLQCQGNSLSGTYSYDSRGIAIRISGSIDWLAADRGNLTILEYNDKGMVTGFFRGELSGNAIVGSWSTPDGKRVLGFRLQSGSTPANATVVVKPDSEKPLAPLKAKCVTTAPSADEIKTTCTFRDFKSLSHGMADMAGRYTYSYTLYKMEGKEYLQVSNAALFQSARLQELERILNDRLKSDVASMRDGAPECYNGFRLPAYLINQFGVYFGDDQIFFAVEFDMPSACRSVGGSVVSLSLSEIQPYLVQP